MHARSLRCPATVSALCLLLVAGACARGGESASTDSGADSAVPAATTANCCPAPSDADSVAAAVAGAAPAAKVADHEFLRRMSDHHQGLIDMAIPAMSAASTPATQGDAHELHAQQEQERDSLVAMIRRSYGERHTPTAPPSQRQMIEMLRARSGAAYDSTFYRHVLMHHREGIAMIDQYLPRLAREDVRTMAVRMKGEMQRDIVTFERKMRAS